MEDIKNLPRAVVCVALASCVVAVLHAQNPAGRGGQAAAPPQQPQSGQSSTADPYFNNPAAGTQSFPLAAPAGSDSRATNTAPAGAANQGPFDPATWTYGSAFSAPPGSTIWNPVKLKMQHGGKVTGGTVFSATDPSTYCAMANAGYDFIWTEMQHDYKGWPAAAPRECQRPAHVSFARSESQSSNDQIVDS